MTTIDRALLNRDFPLSTWGNLGLWTEARHYPAACEALAVKLAQTANLQRGCSVLDVGFGYGDQLLLWKERFGVGNITGVETDSLGVTEGRRKVAAYADISLRHSDGGLQTSEDHFDRVLALDCAYHFAPRSEFFIQARNALHPGGVLALTDLVIADRVRSGLHTHLAKLFGIPPENLLTQQDYRQSLLDAGFYNVTFELLDEAVLGGFSRYGWRLLRRHGIAALGAGGRKVLATAAVAAWLHRGHRVHYAVVSAGTSQGSN